MSPEKLASEEPAQLHQTVCGASFHPQFNDKLLAVLRSVVRLVSGAKHAKALNPRSLLFTGKLKVWHAKMRRFSSECFGTICEDALALPSRS